MKIGVLSDIHGNVYALEQVLIALKRYEIQKIFILGDLIGYYHHPKLVIELLKEFDCEVIRGNHESLLIDFCSGDENYKETIRKKYGLGHDAVLEQFSLEEMDWLCNLPLVSKIHLNGLNIILAHGSPKNNEQYIYPNTKEDVLMDVEDKNADFIFIGHTHYPFVYSGKYSQIINVGSVGQSRVVGGVASWGVLDTTNKVYIPQNTPYDVSQLINELESMNDIPSYLINILLRNRDE